MFGVSICLIFVFGIGLIPLVFLLYLHFGSITDDKDHKGQAVPPQNTKEYLDWANKEGRWSDREVKEG